MSKPSSNNGKVWIEMDDLSKTATSGTTAPLEIAIPVGANTDKPVVPRKLSGGSRDIEEMAKYERILKQSRDRLGNNNGTQMAPNPKGSPTIIPGKSSLTEAIQKAQSEGKL